MSRPKIIEVDYFGFQQALRRTADSGERVLPADKERWSDWVRRHRVKEAAFRSFGQSKYDGLEPVIIDTEGPWRGYYLVSKSEETCLKWERAPGDA